jgi:hypothetical protein
LTLTDIPNHKQLYISRWLNYEINTQSFMYEMFYEYNPDYPDKIERIIKI